MVILKILAPGLIFGILRALNCCCCWCLMLICILPEPLFSCLFTCFMLQKYVVKCFTLLMKLKFCVEITQFVHS